MINSAPPLECMHVIGLCEYIINPSTTDLTKYL
jgi:hypothetical protein